MRGRAKADSPHVNVSNRVLKSVTGKYTKVTARSTCEALIDS